MSHRGKSTDRPIIGPWGGQPVGRGSQIRTASSSSRWRRLRSASRATAIGRRCRSHRPHARAGAEHSAHSFAAARRAAARRELKRQPVPLGVGAAPPPALRGRRDATRPGQVSLGARRRGASRPGRMAAPPADVRTGRPESSTCPGSSPKPRACRRRSPPGTVRTAPTSGSPPACASGRRRRYRRPSAGS